MGNPSPTFRPSERLRWCVIYSNREGPRVGAALNGRDTLGHSQWRRNDQEALTFTYFWSPCVCTATV